jgi:ATP-dependent Clp protease ATP-binding subunit ClpC
MAFNFDLRGTKILKAVIIEKFLLFRYAKILKNFFIVLFIISTLMVGFSLFDLASSYSATRTMVLFLSLYLLFWNIDLFLRLKIKKPELVINLQKVSLDPDSYNLAEFLNFNAAQIVLDAINLCKKKKIILNSVSLLYSAIKLSKDVDLICLRLGLNPKKLLIDIKNYLEKTERMTDGELFSSDFQRTIESALKFSAEKNHDFITEEDILIALSKEDEFFKKTLVEFDLKSEDVENLSSWISSAESLIAENRKFWSYENLLRQGSMGKDFAAGYTLTLDKYSVDWRGVVAKWRSREIIGHKKEIEQVETILSKSSMANVLIVGDPGTGRKSIMQALAQKCFLGTSLPELNNRRVVELDVVMLAAQIPDFDRLEATLDQIFSEVISSGNVILVIDNLENFVGQKMQKAGAVDVSGILSKYLPIPNFQFVGITTYDGLHKNIEENPSFAGFFQKVEVAEVTEAETINILQSAALELEYSHKVLVLYPSIREIVNLTARYMPSLLFPKKALDVLEEAVVYVQRLKEKIVLPHHIAEIISKRTDIPVGKMEVKEKEVLLNLENLIHERIINQEEAVSQISTAMRRARMGIASKTRPMGTFLFLGPTGVGKTETAKALAQIYFGSEKKMMTLDMSEFQEVSDIPRLLGSTSPVDMQGLLTTPVRDAPFSLVLLDEIEKAHPNILNLFLQILDEGHITDGQGRKVVFSSTIIICTSNAGADMIFKQVEANQIIDKDKLLDSLFEKNIFRPEFVNRFDSTVIFHPLTKDNLMKIAQLSLKSLQKSLKEKDIDFEITESLKEKIVELSYKPEFGAREMRRVVQDKVESVVAEALLADKIKKGDKMEINSENFEIIVNPAK